MNKLLLAILVVSLTGCSPKTVESQITCTKNGITTWESNWNGFTTIEDGIYMSGEYAYKPDVGELCKINKRLTTNKF